MKVKKTSGNVDYSVTLTIHELLGIVNDYLVRSREIDHPIPPYARFSSIPQFTHIEDMKKENTSLLIEWTVENRG